VKQVYASLSTLEIHHLKNLLQAGGIACRVLGESLASAAGELPLTECAMRLCVEDDRDERRALELLAEMRAPARCMGPAWHCPACAEVLEAQFTACWHCGTARA
jgi:hypothetical protein